MGVVDRVQTIVARPRRDPKIAAVQSGGSVPRAEVLEVVTPDQDRARAFSARIPLVAETYRTAAMLAAACRLRPEYQTDSGEFEAAGSPAERDFTVEYALSTYRPREGTQANLIEREYRLRERIGEAWRTQLANPNGANWWNVYDPIAITKTGSDSFAIARTPGASRRDGTLIVVPRQMVQRVWSPHDSWDLWATSPTFAILDECRQYILAGRNTARRLASRFTNGRKILYTPGQAHQPLPEDQQVPGGPMTDLEKLLLEFSTLNAGELADDNVGAVAPLHVHWPTIDGKSGAEVLDLGEQLDPENRALRADLRLEIAQGLPYPTQLVLEGPGAGGNHWGDWLADDKAIQQIKARLGDICEGITVGVLRPTLQVLVEAGLWLGDPDRVRVGFDPTPITQNPDNFDKLEQLRERGVIGPAPVLREVGLTDDNLATPDERALALEFLKGNAAQIPQAVSAQRPPAEPAKNTIAAAAPSTVDAPTAALIAAGLHQRERIVAAAAKPTIGTQLRAEDDRYRAEVTAAFTTAMAEAVRRAGVKLQSKAQRKSATVQASARDAADVGVFPPAVLAAVGTDNQDLLHGAFDTLAATIAALLAAHRTRQRKLLDAQLADPPDPTLWDAATEERAGAIRSWLPAAITLAAAARLAGDTQPQGEQPVAPAGTVVPPFDLVDATIRASNGAAIRDGQVDSPTPGRADDAVGLVDPQIEAPLATAGVLPLYQWIYGDPGDRAVNFEPHLALDGVTWDDDTRSDVLANSEAFPATDEFYPGDHSGCQCHFEVVWTEGQAGDFGPQDIIGSDS